MASRPGSPKHGGRHAARFEDAALPSTQPRERSPMLAKDSSKELLLRSTSSLLLTTWLFEILSFCAALAVFATVVIVLATYNGRPNPLWSGGITLNTVISFASMLFRISLMVPVASCISQLSWIWFAQARRPLYDVVRFDQASRSPYGSLKLLFSHHIKSFAFIGALVTVTSLVIGPFFQQSLVFYSAPVVDGSSVSYTSHASGFNNTVGLVPLESTDPRQKLRVPFNMRSAAYNGFLSFGAASLSNPPFSCPSGNCTWGPFPTLAIGVQCRDAPEQFRLDCAGYNDSITLPKGCTIRGDNQPTNTTRLVILNEQAPQIQPTIFHFAVASNHGAYQRNPRYIPDVQSRRADVEWVRATNLVATGEWYDYMAPNSTYESRQCKLYTCVQVIEARVESGIYNEDVLQEINNPVLDPPLPETVESGRIYEYTATWMYNHGDGLSVNITLSSDEQEVILDNLQSPFLDAGMDIEDYVKYASLNKTGVRNFTEGPELVRMIYRAPNLTDVVYALARHTNVALRSIRTFQDLQANDTLPKDHVSEQERVEGLVWIDKIHVKVRWVWLVLPAALAVLVLTLLIATIALSKVERVGIWKDDPLPLLLFSRWDGYDKVAVKTAQTQEDVREAVEGLRAQLANDVDVGHDRLKGTLLIERIATAGKGWDRSS